MQVEIGTILSGKYRIDEILGRGGMGLVVGATHLQLDERVAIKFLLPEAVFNPDAVARFTREARASVKIKSEHVARVIDVGTVDGVGPYLVMERLVGVDLGALLAHRHTLPVEEAVDYVLQASEAVAEAHSLGIVHRDLKPTNLFLTQRADGSACVKVLDFGISKILGTEGQIPEGLTQSSVAMGSPNYMSPEQLTSSRDVDARTDVWALGAILYEFLCGHPPFRAPSFAELCTKVLMTAPAPIRSSNPEVSPELEQAIFAALARDQGQRLANVALLAERIVPFGSRTSRISAERIGRVLHTAGLSGTALVLPESQPDPQKATIGGFGHTVPPKNRPTPRLVATAALGLVLAAIAVALARSPAASPSTASAGTPLEPSASPTVTRVAAPEPRSAPPAFTADEAPTVVPVVPPSTSPAIHTAPAVLPPIQTVKRRPAPTVPSASSAPSGDSKANCVPNFYFDEHGEKHFKPHCF